MFLLDLIVLLLFKIPIPTEVKLYNVYRKISLSTSEYNLRLIQSIIDASLLAFEFKIKP